MSAESAKKPLGRPPKYCLLQDGVWVLTPEGEEKAAARLEKHRTACRERYRRARQALRTQRPELFQKRRHAQTLDHCCQEDASLAIVA